MTGRSRHPERATLGVRSHSGWAAYVVLAGDARDPKLVTRDRMQLCDPAIIGSKQPFHQAEPMTFDRAVAFIHACTTATAKLARRAVSQIDRETPLRACCVLTAAGKPLPDLRTILSSHALIHTAEGEFYRDAVAAACDRCEIAVRRVRERDMENELQKLPVTATTAKERIAAFGKQVGPPWTQDEKLAALGAWLMLAVLPSRH
jgi:hypothetical protein